MTKLTDNLYLGSAAEVNAAIAAGCDAVVNVADNWTDTPAGTTHWYCVPLADGAGNTCSQFYNVIALVNGLIAAGYTVFLHCLAGVNRGPTMAMLYYHVYMGYTLDTARIYITSVHPASAPWAALWSSVEACYPPPPQEGFECGYVECCLDSPWQEPIVCS